jgi:hypothetical protein
MPKTWTKKAAPWMKIVGGASAAVTVGSMVTGNAFNGYDRYFAMGVVAASAFLAARGITQIFYGDDA